MDSQKPPHDYNPYQAPESPIHHQNSASGDLLDEPARLPVGSGIDWIKEAWAIFMARPLLWLGVGLAYFVFFAIMGLVPVLNIISGLLNVFFVAGMAYMAYQIDADEPVAFGDLFVGFTHQAGRLAWLSILGVLLSFLIILAVGTLMVFGVMALMGIDAQEFALNDTNIMFFVLLALVLLAMLLPIYMMMMFSPILVLFHEMPAFESMKLSLKACLRNILPFLVYGLVLMVIMFVATLPFALGLIAAIPLMYISIYTAYKQILTNA